MNRRGERERKKRRREGEECREKERSER